jgi:hypothetical protein
MSARFKTALGDAVGWVVVCILILAMAGLGILDIPQ